MSGPLLAVRRRSWRKSLSILLTQADVFKACRTLFGDNVEVSSEFLSYLQPSGVKSAYRRRVKETHPDVFAGDDGQRRLHTGLFQELVAAYELFGNYFQQREQGGAPEASTAPAAGARSSARQWAATGADREGASSNPYHSYSRPASSWQQHAGSKHFYAGSLPDRTLEFGLFLYYQRLIDYRQLIEALLWQRRQRPNLGDIAQRWGWLTDDQVRGILTARGNLRRFGEKAVHLQYLTDRQLTTLLYYQRSRQKRLGEFFIEQNILSSEDIERMVRAQLNHNRQFAVRPFRHRDF